MTHGPKREAALYRAARAWWRNKRPLSFSLEQHLANPAINTTTDAESTLAHAVANTYGSKNKVKR